MEFNSIDNKAKYRHPKKVTWNGTLLQVFICLRPPTLLGFCLGWSSNFVGFESGQIQIQICDLWTKLFFADIKLVQMHNFSLYKYKL
jgi:hypothetical protein